MTSASCSRAPLSRRSESCGLKSRAWRASTARDYRDVQLLGERLERARDLRDLLLATLHRGAAAHELEIVDDEQVQAVLGLHPARFGARLQHREAGAVVD